MMRLDRRSRLLIERLKMSNIPVTSAELAAATGVSSRTVKNDLKRIAEFLPTYGAELSAKPGTGFVIMVNDKERFSDLEMQMRFESREQYKRIPQTKIQRINHVIMKLLSVDYCLDLDDLAEEMHIEKSTLTSYLKEIRSMLARYMLELRSDPRSGIIVEGSEIHKRICISEFFFHNYMEESLHAEDNVMFSSPQSKSEIRRIRAILLRVMKQYNLQLSAFSVENLSIHIMVALRRWTLFDYVRIDKDVECRIRNTVEEVAGKQLMRELETEYGIILPESEAMYFALHLKSKLINVKTGGWDRPEDKEKLINTIIEVFDSIQNRYGIDLHGDTTIQNYLIAHIRTMLERLEIGFPLRNSQPYEPMREFLMATQLTQIAIRIIEKNYGVSMDENEESFLVLYFNLALYRLHMKQGLRIAVTNGSGRPEGIILLNKITQARKGIPDTITFIDVAELEEINENDYDIIVSPTDPLQAKTIPVLLLGSGTMFDTEKLQKVIDLSRLGHIDYQALFPEDALMFSVGGHDKDTVFEEMEKRFIAEGDMTSANGVRNATLVELGKNCAAIFTSEPVKKSFIKVFCLKKLVVMKKTPVQTVFWIDAPKSETDLLNVLLDVLSQWLQSDQNTMSFNQNPSRQRLIEQLEQQQTYSDAT